MYNNIHDLHRYVPSGLTFQQKRGQPIGNYINGFNTDATSLTSTPTVAEPTLMLL